MTPHEYIKHRVANGIGWYRISGDKARKRFLWMRSIAVIGGAAVPVLVNLSFHYQAFVTTAISLVVVVFVSLEGVWHFRDQWRNYRSTSSAIEHEFFAYETEALPYSKFMDNDAGKKAAFAEFVQRVENFVGHEVESTLSVMAAVEKKSPEAPQDALKKTQEPATGNESTQAIQDAIKNVQLSDEGQKDLEAIQDALKNVQLSDEGRKALEAIQGAIKNPPP
jgi:hypothetical protein